MTKENTPHDDGLDFSALFDTAVSRLFTAFPPDTLRLVGGCVRNHLLGHAVDDIDLATQLVPDDVEATLKAAKIRCVSTGREHGTLTAVIDKVSFEITSLRKDVETDGRRAVITFTQDWAEDAQRRDFTMNALYVDAQGVLYDPTGQGLSDLAAMRLRFIGEADQRIAEDYLRILRYFRFVAYYMGKSPLDKEALNACRQGAHGLKTLSSERVWTELKKLLSADRPERALQTLLHQDILELLLPEASNVDGLMKFVQHEVREALKPDPLLRLMAMSAREPLQIALLCKRLKMSNAESARLRAWAQDDTALDPFANERTILAAIYSAGHQTTIDRAYLRAAGEGDPIKSARWMALAERAQNWSPPDFPLSGKDLKAEGLAPGPDMGKTLEALKALWIRSGFTADRKKLLMALKLIHRG